MSNYTLSAVFKLRDQFSQTINNARSSFGKLGDSFKKNHADFKAYQDKMKGQLNSFNSSVKTIERTAMGIGAGVAVAVGSAYKTYVDFNKQMVKNKAISGASTEEFARMTKQVKELGASTAFSATQVAQAQQYQAMAGYDVNRVLATTPGLLKLAVATGSDLAQTSDMITDSMDAFGLSAEDTNRYLDVLTATANNSNTSVEGLGEAYRSAAPQARNWGESLEEVNIMLGLMANNGIKASMAGTGLGAMYSRLMKPTDEMNKQFGKTKTVLVDANGKMKGLRQILKEAKPHLDKMTQAEKNLWMSTIAGQEHIKSLSAIMNSSSDSVEKMEKKIYGAKGSLDAFYETMKGADQQTIDEMKSAFEALKLQVGEAASPIILERMKQLTSYMTTLGSSDTFSTENMRKFFSELSNKLEAAVALFATYKIAILTARAAMGDVTAIAGLTALGIAAVAYGGSNTDAVTGEDKYGTSRPQEKHALNERHKANMQKATEITTQVKRESGYLQAPKVAPTINFNAPLTFHTEQDGEKYFKGLIDQLATRQ